MTEKKLVRAAKSGDRLQTLEALRDELAETIANCKSGRDMAALSKRLIETTDKIAELKGETVATEKSKPAEVSAFETIAKRRTERRKAATG